MCINWLAGLTWKIRHLDIMRSIHVKLGSLVKHRLICPGIGYHAGLNHRVPAIERDYVVSDAE